MHVVFSQIVYGIVPNHVAGRGNARVTSPVKYLEAHRADVIHARVVFQEMILDLVIFVEFPHLA